MQASGGGGWSERSLAGRGGARQWVATIMIVRPRGDERSCEGVRGSPLCLSLTSPKTPVILPGSSFLSHYADNYIINMTLISNLNKQHVMAKHRISKRAEPVKS